LDFDRTLGARDLADVMILESGVCREKQSQWHLDEVSCRWLVFLLTVGWRLLAGGCWLATGCSQLPLGRLWFGP
jgi:hypothetical protein